MSPSAQPRPRQVTVTAWTIILGSTFVVATAFEQVRTMRSLERREALERMLGQEPFAGLGIGVEGALQVMHVASMVAAASAVVSGILGIYLLQRRRAARLGVSVAAVPPFLTGFLVSDWGLMAAVVAASAVMLWLQPARNWFLGLPAPEPPRLGQRSGAPERSAERSSERTPAGSHQLPPDWPGEEPQPQPQQPQQEPGPVWPSPPPPPQGPQQPGPQGGPTPYAGFGAHAGTHLRAWPEAAPRANRPSSVVAACVLTWTGTALAMGMMGMLVLAVLAAPDLVMQEMERQRPDIAEQFGETELRRTIVGAGLLIVVWSAIAAGLAVLVWMRRPWASHALLVSTGAAAAFCFVGVVGNVLLLVPLALCVATFVMLLRPETRAWLRSR